MHPEARLPRSVDAAMLNLREVIARKLEGDDRKAGEIVRQLLDFAENLERNDEPGDNSQN